MNFDIFLTLYHSRVTIINCLKGILTIFLLGNFVCSLFYMITGNAKTILFELFVV